jgi:hypothetical protein
MRERMKISMMGRGPNHRLVDASTGTDNIDTAKLAISRGEHALQLKPVTDIRLLKDGTCPT